MKRPRKQLLLKLGVFLLLGAIVNVAVAFIFAAYGAIPKVFLDLETYCRVQWAIRPPSQFPPHATSVASSSAFGVERTDMFAMTTTASSLRRSWHTFEQMQSLHKTARPEAQELLEQHRRELENTQEAETTAHFSMQSIVCGVPMHTLAGARWLVRDFRRGEATQSGTTSAFEWSSNQPKGTGATSARLIPKSPIWPGFAINTIFYAALLWILFCGPGKIRRLVRIRRGRCPACGYPIGTSDVCTECGNPVRARSVQST